MTVSSPPHSSFSLSSFLLSSAPIGFLLSWVAGFVDTAAFIILFDLFTAHVTGNLALAGSFFANSDHEGTLTRLVMIPVFMTGVALASLLARHARQHQWPVLAVLLTAEAIALSIFMYVGVRLSPTLILDVQEDLILPIGVTGVLAMAIQNALMKEAKESFKGYIPTTVMTGNTTQLTIDLVQLVLAKFSTAPESASQEAKEACDRIGRTFPILLGFVLGGAAAAYFVSIAEFWSLALPLVTICILAIAAYSQPAKTTPDDTH
ncbi:DUF1275 domain-containing protein [Desertifilum sp. FACHB-1129]|uniref:DUF1275 domain-containing protein n=2 Tax=Desertifilum tharense IPPAS B-1220 TaxID=1781255 RepID=A0A1E5QH03_9CYAN|nr:MULTISPECIES: YoaK family protein [Desertifilum]MCD8485648.1 DUF1275 domain-containing protein [Desertifilum sp.]MDA0213647.1 YoaK family protein [Cyanobacteria bacterium FC1]MBD2314128.1 DUF1275 domain-containing protein [Desertifilum sp. FACHB-1129]MBD2323614.1 DUF1275 domain-containing protein [Desertifilum sp. FACHB-866]MBD2335066.1 DUF1275 domain-containing protein [Desertifilum sp. FACHB-868]